MNAILLQNQNDAVLRALHHWRSTTIKLRLQAEMAVVPKKPSYELALRDIEEKPYDEHQPWHPAVGQKLLQLPLLTGSKKCLDGTVGTPLPFSLSFSRHANPLTVHHICIATNLSLIHI